MFLVTGGAGIQEHTDENLTRADIVELSRKVHLYVDDEIQKDFDVRNPRAAKVHIRLKSGDELYEDVVDLRPMNSAETDAKFRKLAAPVLNDEQREVALSRIRQLDDVSDVSHIAPLLIAR